MSCLKVFGEHADDRDDHAELVLLIGGTSMTWSDSPLTIALPLPLPLLTIALPLPLPDPKLPDPVFVDPA